MGSKAPTEPMLTVPLVKGNGTGQENSVSFAERTKHDNALSTLSLHGLGPSGYSRRENICPRK